ncbi:LytR/AlgR family response regulator transcription factor [Brumicola blandensis]|uniref:LytTR family DNA-binding domain-containing protein n=1 Tax=Brumicola blandensis TaxID=3075611 RepID=A0AAW8QZS5_9ALTE|nr:LytTR family DNA-binding domain-containing protein [Alteromonas sp. W409]MDT0582125.1 LytTR family DNA-binding domain-containing protein [Alteromonas sp. W409]
MNQKIKAMIVDDEPLAREGLIMRLQTNEHIDIIASCASANEAKLTIAQLMPDVIFLDIEMPGMSGIDLARWLQANVEGTCKIVFVTAYREFALNAFDFEAFDYLLKPFADERLEACVGRLIKLQQEGELAQKHRELDELVVSKTGNSLNAFMQNLETAVPGRVTEMQKTISLKSGTEWLRVKLDSIFWIEAAGDYMCVHTQEGTHIIRKTLKQFQGELDSMLFKQVNRSAIINTAKLSKLTPNSNGEYMALLSSGDSVKVSRKFKLLFDELSNHS